MRVGASSGTGAAASVVPSRSRSASRELETSSAHVAGRSAGLFARPRRSTASTAGGRLGATRRGRRRRLVRVRHRLGGQCLALERPAAREELEGDAGERVAVARGGGSARPAPARAPCSPTSRARCRRGSASRGSRRGRCRSRRRGSSRRPRGGGSRASRRGGRSRARARRRAPPPPRRASGASAPARGGPALRRSASVPPGAYSMTMNGSPSSFSPTSWIAMTNGSPVRLAAICASRMKRAWNSSFSRVPLGQHLDRDRATEDLVLRPEHVSHAAVRDRLPVGVARRKRGPIPRHLLGVPARAASESSNARFARSSQPFASATAAMRSRSGPRRSPAAACEPRRARSSRAPGSRSRRVRR